MIDYASEYLIGRIADVLVRDDPADRRQRERAAWLETLRPKPGSTPEAHRARLDAIVSNLATDVLLEFVDRADNERIPSEAGYEAMKAAARDEILSFDELLAEVRGIDVATLRRLDGWDD